MSRKKSSIARSEHELLASYVVWQARKEILKIHTRQWTPPLSEAFLEELADKCVGKLSTCHVQIHASLTYSCPYCISTLKCDRKKEGINLRH